METKKEIRILNPRLDIVFKSIFTQDTGEIFGLQNNNVFYAGQQRKRRHILFGRIV